MTDIIPENINHEEAVHTMPNTKDRLTHQRLVSDELKEMYALNFNTLKKCSFYFNTFDFTKDYPGIAYESVDLFLKEPLVYESPFVRALQRHSHLVLRVENTKELYRIIEFDQANITAETTDFFDKHLLQNSTISFSKVKNKLQECHRDMTLYKGYISREIRNLNVEEYKYWNENNNTHFGSKDSFINDNNKLGCYIAQFGKGSGDIDTTPLIYSYLQLYQMPEFKTTTLKNNKFEKISYLDYVNHVSYMFCVYGLIGTLHKIAESQKLDALEKIEYFVATHSLRIKNCDDYYITPALNLEGASFAQEAIPYKGDIAKIKEDLVEKVSHHYVNAKECNVRNEFFSSLDDILPDRHNNITYAKYNCLKQNLVAGRFDNTNDTSNNNDINYVINHFFSIDTLTSAARELWDLGAYVYKKVYKSEITALALPVLGTLTVATQARKCKMTKEHATIQTKIIKVISDQIFENIGELNNIDTKYSLRLVDAIYKNYIEHTNCYAGDNFKPSVIHYANIISANPENLPDINLCNEPSSAISNIFYYAATAGLFLPQILYYAHNFFMIPDEL